MFEDSLVESTGRIRTRSKAYAIGSFAIEAALLATFTLIPYLYPDSLPRQALATLLVAPPPPAAPAMTPQAPATRFVNPVQLTGLVAPTIIPRQISEGNEGSHTPPGMDFGSGPAGKGDVRGAMSVLGSTPPPPANVVRAQPSGPLHISSGVAAGRLLTPIRPEYPAIARTAHVQGTVVIEAVITKEGFVDQARVVSGPPLLAPAALQAVQRARYTPYKLNGEPVDVETTINIVFSLDD